MVHIPAKFRENTSMRFRVTVRKLNVTDEQTDGRTDGRTGGRCNISRPRAYGAAGEIIMLAICFMNATYLTLLSASLARLSAVKQKQ